MTREERKRFWRAYWTSLLVSYVISLLSLPFVLHFIPNPNFLIGLEIFLYAGFVFGTAFFLLGTAREAIRLPSFALNLALQTLLVSVTIAVGATIVTWSLMSLNNRLSPIDPEVISYLKQFFLTPDMGLTLGIGLLISFLINSVFQISRKLGPGILWNWMTGKYYSPREEERIFMFLDLRGSTALGEHLGNLRFSEFVRDFFRDLTYPVLETKGEVSHFIGDEAVLTWKPGAGLDKASCIEMFFKMKERVDASRSWYESKYGVFPSFKAGLHIGPVVATEVGEIKSEIVYHGDVLNTAARIQSLCNEEGEDLLASGDLVERLPQNGKFEYKPLGNRTLKGKEHDVELFAVRIGCPEKAPRKVADPPLIRSEKGG